MPENKTEMPTDFSIKDKLMDQTTVMPIMEIPTETAMVTSTKVQKMESVMEILTPEI